MDCLQKYELTISDQGLVVNAMERAVRKVGKIQKKDRRYHGK